MPLLTVSVNCIIKPLTVFEKTCIKKPPDHSGQEALMIFFRAYDGFFICLYSFTAADTISTTQTAVQTSTCHNGTTPL